MDMPKYFFSNTCKVILKLCSFWLVQLDATGRPDESLALELVGPLQPTCEENSQNGKLLSFSLQKGQLKANICYRPLHSITLEVS